MINYKEKKYKHVSVFNVIFSFLNFLIITFLIHFVLFKEWGEHKEN